MRLEEPPTAMAPAPVTAIEPQPAAQTEVFRAPQTPVPAVKAEATLRAVVATPATAPEAQSGGKTAVLGKARGAAASEVSAATQLDGTTATAEARLAGIEPKPGAPTEGLRTQ